MAGNTDEEKKVALEKQAEIDKLNAALEKEKTRVENAEKKINEWGNEVGELRKERESMKDTLKEANDLIASMKEAADKRSTETHAGNPKEKEASEDTSEDIEKRLSDEQRKAGEEGFNTLKDAEKLQYENDPKFKLSFLKRLENVAPVIPTSPWKTALKKKEDEGSGYKSILDRVFAKKRQASYVPQGSQSGAPVFGGNKSIPEEPPEDSRVH